MCIRDRGDFNQWPVQEALQDFPDITEADVGPTRKDRCIDRVFTNFGRSVVESGQYHRLNLSRDLWEPGATIELLL